MNSMIPTESTIGSQLSLTIIALFAVSILHLRSLPACLTVHRPALGMPLCWRGQVAVLTRHTCCRLAIWSSAAWTSPERLRVHNSENSKLQTGVQSARK